MPASLLVTPFSMYKPRVITEHRIGRVEKLVVQPAKPITTRPGNRGRPVTHTHIPWYARGFQVRGTQARDALPKPLEREPDIRVGGSVGGRQLRPYAVMLDLLALVDRQLLVCHLHVGL